MSQASLVSGYSGFDQHPLTREPLRSIVPVVAGHRTDGAWHIWLSDPWKGYTRELTPDAARRLAAELLRYAELVEHGSTQGPLGAADSAT